MKDGYIKIAAACPDVRVGDVEYNLASAIKEARTYAELGAKVIVFPELTLTSASCGDMIFNTGLLCAAEEALSEFVKRTALVDAISVIGVPIAVGASVYSCATAVKGGRVLAFVPLRAAVGDMPSSVREISYAGYTAPLSERTVIGSELSRELRAVIIPADDASGEAFAREAEATLVIIPAAEPEGVDISERRRAATKEQARRLSAAVVYANAGAGESGSECVYSGHSVIADAEGNVKYREPFSDAPLTMTADVEVAMKKKRHKPTRVKKNGEILTVMAEFEHAECEPPYYTRRPFVPEDEGERRRSCRLAFEIQAQGLAGRFERSYSKCMVVGISGGLDSTLALLVMARAVDILKGKGRDIDRGAIRAVTMPCFGTTERTKGNAERLSELLGASVRCIDIKAAVSRHFEDIGHSKESYDVVYENAQARERTQVLMDIANAEGGLVVGTGDLSEAALGWATYNGDHMSMYGVNASVPKTMVRAIVEDYADGCESCEIRATLRDILATPVSPELLPPRDGEIAQETESIVGPYELHDFFIYHFVREGASPEKLLRMATSAFRGVYGEETVEGWCRVFLKRFISQQFKRSCTPDAPSVGIVSLSPRGAWKMPSDFSPSLFTLGKS